MEMFLYWMPLIIFIIAVAVVGIVLYIRRRDFFSSIMLAVSVSWLSFIPVLLLITTSPEIALIAVFGLFVPYTVISMILFIRDLIKAKKEGRKIKKIYAILITVSIAYFVLAGITLGYGYFGTIILGGDPMP